MAESCIHLFACFVQWYLPYRIPQRGYGPCFEARYHEGGLCQYFRTVYKAKEKGLTLGESKI